MLEFIHEGLIPLPWWGYIIVALLLTHITIVTVTVFLHRCQAHRGVELHPLASHFFRFWLWIASGMITKQWVAIHRKHHAKCETHDDPHSPQIVGIRKVLLEGTELYRAEAKIQDTLDDYGHGTPDDWLERFVYTRLSDYGVYIMLTLDLLLFGVYGIIIWAVQLSWIPFWAAGVINGTGHYWGYRNYETPDASTNITNLAIFIGGEELHNNHHAYPSSAKFSTKWWEVDIGWMYLRLFQAMGLAKIKKVAPKPQIVDGKYDIDMETLKAIIVSRLHVMAQYAKRVTKPVLRDELKNSDQYTQSLLRRGRMALLRDESRVDEKSMSNLVDVLKRNETLQTVYEFRRKLQELWDRTHANQEKLLQALQDWCRQAEATGIEALQEFAQRLRGYTLQAA